MQKKPLIITWFGELKNYLKSICKDAVSDLFLFLKLLSAYILKHISLSFLHLEQRKRTFATILYRQRGKYARRLMHSGMAGLSAVGIIIAPVVAQEFPGRSIDPWTIQTASVLSVSADETDVTTELSDKQFRDKILKYTVQDGDTISTIALKFDISVDTIRWQNDLPPNGTIKVGQELEILPVTGVSHKVQKGDTIYSIAKKYDIDAQGIVNFPFNAFVNDETFELAVGQVVIVPDGVKPESNTQQSAPRTKQATPNAGSVTATGKFAWPTNGTITTSFSWYHPGIDIANRAAPQVLAADSGTIIAAGWDSTGYGNMVMIDHGNGYRTRYAHLQKIYVSIGQTVARGNAVGQMGSTGRSTGTHLHFEIYKGATRISPLSVLGQ
jgi:murein DD-endopeptidase MepM/ murein hydrolase activator NlpD